jgi:pimeloyl-ACP methyl ester carboxylesterase
MPTATNDGVTLSYERSGPADAETVAFVEGLSYGTWMWRWQREALSDDYETLVWDNRGTGDSDEPEGPYTTEQMAGDFEAVLDDAGVESVHVVGASLGGMIAQQYALDYDRAASLTLIATSPGGEDAVPIPEETQQHMLEVPDEYDEAEAIRYKMRPAVTDAFWEDHPEVIDRIVEWRLETDPSDRAYEWQAAAAVEFDASDRLGELDPPTLLVHGTADQVVPFENAELLGAALPDARLEPIEGGSHLCFIERSDTVNEHLRTFLDDV